MPNVKNSMLWYDAPTKNTTFEDRMAHAADYFTKKYGIRPGFIFTRTIPEGKTHIAGMEIIPWDKLPPNHVAIVATKPDYLGGQS